MLKNDLEILNGVGPKTKESLLNLGIRNTLDTLLFLPSFLIDKTQLSNILEIKNGEKALFIGVITTIFKTKSKKPSLILKVDIGDSTIQIRFLNKIIIYSYLKKGDKIRFSGILYKRNNLSEMIHPDIEVINEKLSLELITPYYKTKRIISQNKIRNIIQNAYKYLNDSNMLSELLSPLFLNKFQLPEFTQALKDCHFPSDKKFEIADIKFRNARKRFILEELFAQKVNLTIAHSLIKKNNSFQIETNNSDVEKALENLDFVLTSSQENALIDIQKSLSSKTQSMRLIQGDVGCGKTVLAMLACFFVVNKGLQCALMAPTEILCDQHFESFKKFFEKFNINVDVLKSNKSSVEKNETISAIADGSIQIVVGTHSLIQKNVKFFKLGLIIIDEQHKFGVKQRTMLTEKTHKEKFFPHQIFLSATPIPRSLSLVLYQGIDYTLIDELPKNRQPTVTKLIKDQQRDDMYEEIRAILKNSGQIYWVCSCIDYTEELEAEYVHGVYEKLKSIFNLNSISFLHGRMTNSENNKTINDFKSGKIQILVCTTIIEVGVNVENAICIVVENAERFGLSQLHQLRGRVGRGNKESFCYLVYKDGQKQESFGRLEAIEKSTNGFEIAEEDLKLRGSGDYLGLKQSGEYKNFKLASSEDAIENFDFLKESIIEECLIDDDKGKDLIERWDMDIESGINL